VGFGIIRFISLHGWTWRRFAVGYSVVELIAPQGINYRYRRLHQLEKFARCCMLTRREIDLVWGLPMTLRIFASITIFALMARFSSS
jgi:hypothetical protein